MSYKTNRKLKRLGNKEFAEDIKQFIKYSHNFYEAKVPELKVLAKRLHEEYSLTDFYKVFNRLWKSGYNEEKALGLYTLQQHKDNYDLETWKFFKPKLAEMKSWDQVDWVATHIVGHILVKYPSIENDLIKFMVSNSQWLKRIAIMSTIPMIKEGNTDLAIRLIQLKIGTKNEHLQKAVGIVINEISKKDPELAKDIILKHVHMPQVTFNYATEELKELRKLRGIKKLRSDKFAKFIFWK